VIVVTASAAAIFGRAEAAGREGDRGVGTGDASQAYQVELTQPFACLLTLRPVNLAA